MPFVRRKRGRLLLVHSLRTGGRVVQQELAAFSSAPELEEILDPGVWGTWCRSQERAHPGLSWDWEVIRGDLASGAAGLADATPAAAVSDALGKLASELMIDLAGLSPARAADRAILDPVRTILKLLSVHINRVVGSPEAPARRQAVIQPANPVEDAFDEAMEHWWRGDRKRAVQAFRQVLQEDPAHADAYNHLGIAAMEEGRLDEAERHFRAAIEGGSRHIEVAGGLLEWGNLENRPYLRAHGNLALVLRRQARWAEAAAVHERMLGFNPHDHQGVRYLLGEEFHRLGDRRRALAAYETADGDACAAFGLGLLLLEEGRTDEADRALLNGMAENRYVAPMLLAQRWTRLDGWHETNVAEPEHAAWIAESTADLWRSKPGCIDHLGILWHRPSVVAWRQQLDDLMVALRDLEGPSDRRRALLGARAGLVRGDHLERVRVAGHGEVRMPLELPPESERFEVGNTYVTDMRHRVVPSGEFAHLPLAFRRIVAYEGRIVEAGSAWGLGEPLDSAIRCRRKPHRKPCPGHIRVRVTSDDIAWACTRCRDNGRIHHWRGLAWDLSENQAAGVVLRVPISWSDYESLRQLTLLPSRILLARAEWGADGPTLVGSAAEIRTVAEASGAWGAEDVATVLVAGLCEGGNGFDA